MQAQNIRLPMPGEELDDEDDSGYDEDDEGWDTSAWDDELPEPMSEDEQVNGVNQAPPAADQEGQPRRKRRRRPPPMPKTPNPENDPDAWVPPFEVLPDGTVTGPTLGDGDIERLPEGFEPARGTFEGVMQIFRPPPNGGNPLPPQ